MEDNNLNWTVEYFEAHENECLEVLKERWCDVPLINGKKLHDFSEYDMVRYRGMIQYTFGDVPFLLNHTLVNKTSGEKRHVSAKYRDAPKYDPTTEELLSDMTSMEDPNVVSNRVEFICIPIPGLSQWAKCVTTSKDKNSQSVTSGAKRSIDCADIEEGGNAPSVKHHQPASRTSEREGGVEGGSRDFELIFPFEGDREAPCTVQWFGPDDEVGLLNSRIEVVGFLVLNPAVPAEWQTVKDATFQAALARTPCIRAVSIRPLQHCNPLLDQHFTIDALGGDAEVARGDLLLVLTQVLHGDELAADFLLCHLLSRVYARTESQAFGHLSLNLFNVGSTRYVQRLADLLRLLVTACCYQPLTVDVLNQQPFVPRKDYDTERLVSGRLQLPSGTHLVLDETAMEEGQLSQRGLGNVRALQSVMQDQQCEYDFSFYPIKYPTDVAVLLVSEGRSILKSGVPVKLQPDPTVTNIEETLDAALFFLSGDVVQRIRRYLTAMSLQEFEMDDSLTAQVSEDYAELRKSQNLTPDDLHLWLVLARLVAASHGRGAITRTDWSAAVLMDKQRRARLS